MKKSVHGDKVSNLETKMDSMTSEISAFKSDMKAFMASSNDQNKKRIQENKKL
jgi:hypothetical protein